MGLSAAGTAGLCLILWGVFHWLGWFAKTRVVLALLATAGVGGWLGRALARVAGWLVHLTGTVTGWVLGVALPGALFVVLAILLIHDLHPRGGGPSRRTGYVAFAAGALLVAGLTGIPVLAPAGALLRTALGTVTGFVNRL